MSSPLSSTLHHRLVTTTLTDSCQGSNIHGRKWQTTDTLSFAGQSLPHRAAVPSTCQSELERAGLAGERGVQLVGWNRPAALMCQLAAASLQPQTGSHLTAVSRIFNFQHSFALVVRLHCDTVCVILGHQSVLSWRSAQSPLPFCCSCPDTACSNSFLQTM